MGGDTRGIVSNHVFLSCVGKQNKPPNLDLQSAADFSSDV